MQRLVFIDLIHPVQSLYRFERSKLLYGNLKLTKADHGRPWQIKATHISSLQALSGTGSLRIGAHFLHRVLGRNTVYYSNPTWANHPDIFEGTGFTDLRQYRYWDAENRNLDFSGMLEDLGQAPSGAVLVLHACAHNPTGLDPTKEQWAQIAEVCKSRNLFVFFDCAWLRLRVDPWTQTPGPSASLSTRALRSSAPRALARTLGCTANVRET